MRRSLILRTIIGLLGGLAAVTVWAPALIGQESFRTTADGVFTAAQVERGAAAYTEGCARCHGDNLDGVGAAPMLYSSRFLDRWREDSLDVLFDFISHNMPPDPRERLTPADYADIIAFLLDANELPAGDTELEVPRLANTLLVGPEGPRPLPPATTVRVVGCLTPAGTGWKLARASAPARARVGDRTDATELERSSGTPFGSMEYRLPNATDDHSTAELTTASAKKVQVKGVLNGNGPDARISVLHLAPLAQDCPR